MDYNNQYDQMMREQMRAQLAAETPPVAEKTQESFNAQDTPESTNQNIDQKPADISAIPEPSSTQQSVDDAQDSLDNLIQNTFGGDPKKIAKSYLESQRAYTRLQAQLGERDQKLTEIESQFQQFDQLLAAYPSLAKQVEQAILGQYNESPNAVAAEPKGKPIQPAQGKLSNPALPTERELIEAGYLGPDDKNTLSSMDYRERLLEARLAYANEHLPLQVAQRAEQQISQRFQQLQEQQRSEQLAQLNQQRFSESFDRAVAKFGLDFTSTHAALQQEILNTTKAFRDPDNLNLLSEDAFELAAQRVLTKHNMLPKTSAPAATPEPRVDNGFQSNRPASIPAKPNDFTSKYEERLRQQTMQNVLARNQNRRFLN